jgi:hypothetical protein
MSIKYSFIRLSAFLLPSCDTCDPFQMIRIQEELISITGTVASRIKRREPVRSSTECLNAILATRLLEEELTELYKNDLHSKKEKERVCLDIVEVELTRRKEERRRMRTWGYEVVEGQAPDVYLRQVRPNLVQNHPMWHSGIERHRHLGLLKNTGASVARGG